MKPPTFHLTPQGLDDVKRELDELKNKKLPHLIDRVQSAREQGDLSENSEYHAAREELQLIEGRIEELEEIVSHAKIVSDAKRDVVSIGNKVTIKTDSSTHTYHIVGKYEADPTNKKISDESPLGKALMGKKVGHEVEYEAPVGKVIYKVVDIQ